MFLAVARLVGLVSQFGRAQPERTRHGCGERGTGWQQQEPVRYWAELRRGHHSGPLDSGSWRPTRPDDTTCDVALFDPDTGSLDWAHDQPTYTVMTEKPRCNVTSLRGGEW